jgi:hypothetical protein
MKNLITLSAVVFLFLGANAQSNPKYVAAMEKQVAIIDTAYTEATMQAVYNSLERIGNNEKSEWLPSYYMAYCLVMQSYFVPTKKVDDLCDRADALLDKADSLKPNNSEIFVVRSMICGARIRVNPMARGSKFGAKSSEWLEKAQQSDSLNPRIPLMRGQGLFYTPPAFGGGKDKAKPILEDAVKKFDAFKPADTIAPRWGRQRAVQLVAECNK